MSSWGSECVNVEDPISATATTRRSKVRRPRQKMPPSSHPTDMACPFCETASSIGEIRWPLFDERGHPFLLIGDREQRMENAPLEPHALGERRLIGAVDALLRHHDGGQ